MTLLPVAAADAARFRDLVRARIGIYLADSRAPDLERAVRQAAAAADLTDGDWLHALYELLLRPAGVGAPLDAFVAGLNVGETHFFRDANQMQALQRDILPDLIAARGRHRRLRVWSAGCSTGEEAYTLAILIHRLIPDLPEWDVLVLGTDINGRSLQRARRGVYRAWSLRGVPELARTSYLRPHPDGVEVAPNIRAMVQFAQLNLVEDKYPSPATNTHAMDLILCRNVLLYFGDAEARSVVRRMRDALHDGGWLLLSGVEAGLGVVDGLDRTDLASAVFRRTRRPDLHDGPKPAQPPRAPGPAPPSHAARAAPTVQPDAGGSDLADRNLCDSNLSDHDSPDRDHADPDSRVSDGWEPDGQATACGRALRLWRDGEAMPALGVLARETDRDPLLPQVHYLYGLILLDSGRADEALAAFRRCTYADPGFVLGHLGQAGVLARSGQRRRAGMALDVAARLVADLDPDVAILDWDGPGVAEVWELIGAQRRLLDAGADTARGRP